MNELAVTPTNVIQKGDNLEVSAQTPDEMKQANHALIGWCDHKIKLLRVDYIELDAAWKSAKEKKWKWTTLKRHADMAKKRIEFYRKLKRALELGFYIVPNFPVLAFAIRTDRTTPLRLASMTNSNWRPTPSKNQPTQSLDEGKGGYVSPLPSVKVELDGENTDARGNKSKEWSSWAVEYQDVEFPVCMSKAKIMEACGRAMEIKLFDDFGILSDASIGRRGCGDPIIVGRIRDPRSTTYHQKVISFIISWALNTEAL